MDLLYLVVFVGFFFIYFDFDTFANIFFVDVIIIKNIPLVTNDSLVNHDL